MQGMRRKRFQVFLLIISALILVLYMITMVPHYVLALYTAAKQMMPSSPLSHLVQQSVKPYLPISTPVELLEKLNQYRVSIKLSPFDTSAAVCQGLAGTGNQNPDIFSVCPTCTHATMIAVNKYSYSNQIMEQLLHDAATAEALQSTTLTHACVGERGEMLTLYIVKHDPGAPTIAPRRVQPVPTTQPTYFSEDELWQALIQYRQAHQKSDIGRDENLCRYARKRVQEHIDKMKTTPQSEYPNPDKYPLDAHAGFSADASTGYAFEVAGKNQLAENLAYWPTAKSPVHVIEWGWDTSTEGHREAQLSTQWSHACISGNQGFYVAIYGK
jgi:hypothetical protein